MSFSAIDDFLGGKPEWCFRARVSLSLRRPNLEIGGGLLGGGVSLLRGFLRAGRARLGVGGSSPRRRLRRRRRLRHRSVGVQAGSSNYNFESDLLSSS